MPLLVAFAICAGLFMVFPNGFKFLVGTGVGVAFGGLAFCLAGMVCHALVSAGGFVMFLLAGIVGGWIFAAKG